LDNLSHTKSTAMKCFIISVLCICCTGVYCQKADTKIDTRIDNLAYWMKLAEQGLVSFNPNTPVPAPTYKGSQIKSALIALLNSADVLIDGTTPYSETENSVAINTGNTTKALNSNNAVDLTTFPVTASTSKFTTTDGGNNWTGSPGALPFSYSDPATAISNDNYYYIGYIDNNGQQAVSVSTDEGASWASYLVGATGDKNHLTVDKTAGSAYENHIYNAWIDFGGIHDRHILFTKSSDHAVSWASPISISDASHGSSLTALDQGVNLQTGPAGEVYATWAIYDSWPDKYGTDEAAIGFARSVNGGTSFSNSIRIVDNIRGIRKTKVGKGIRANSFPSMAVDNSYGPNRGTIYVVWCNVGTPFVNTGNDVNIYLIRSTDQGVTWSSPQLVNQTVPGAGQKHFFPWITCDQTNGKLHIIYYDDRNVSSTDLETWMSSSFDGGSTWSDYQISDVSFTPVPVIAEYFGDYLGVTAHDDVIYPVWTDNRTGTALAYTSPLVSADFCPDNLVLQNITLPINATYKYRAGITISVAGGSTNFVMQGNGITGARASMVAGGSITLLPNTSIEKGAVLTIVPGPCNSPILRTGVASSEFTQLKLKPQEFDVNSQINIYPNPIQDLIYIELSPALQNKPNITYVITDLMRTVIANGRITDKLQPVNTSKLNRGGYFISIYENKKLIETRTLVKK